MIARTAAHPEVAEQAEVAPWFMDYRNADGSVAQMCGNGSRVFVAHLLEEGLASTGSFHIATRGGARRVTVGQDGAIRVDMGRPQFLERDDITVRLADSGPGTGVARCRSSHAQPACRHVGGRRRGRRLAAHAPPRSLPPTPTRTA